MGFFEDIISALNQGLNKKYNGKYSHLAKAADVHATTVKKILSGERTTWLGALSRMADATGISICQRDDLQAPAQNMPAQSHVQPVHNYRSIPELGMDKVISVIDESRQNARPIASSGKYFQMPISLEYIKYRKDLIASELPPNFISMAPTLNPGDLVVIDINECIPHSPPGNIYLVQEPGNGSAQIRRVRNQRRENKDYLVFYCDNPEFGPDLFNLDQDYEGKLWMALKGKVVAAFSNMSVK